MAGKVSSDPNVFLLPDIGEGLQEAELKEWLVKPGDTVEENQNLAEVETDKALAEIPSPRAGVIKTLHGEPGDMMPVGEPFVTYEGETGSAGKKQPGPGPKASASKPAGSKPEAKGTSQASNGSADAKPAPPQEDREDAGTVVGAVPDMAMNATDGKALATPAVRRLARDAGVDINAVAGTGIGGRVTAKDVQAAIAGGSTATSTSTTPTSTTPTSTTPASTATGPAVPTTASARSTPPTPRPAPIPPGEAVSRIPFRGVRRKIAERLRASVDSAVHFTVMDEADITDLTSLRKRLGAASGEKLSPLPFVASAICRVLSRDAFRPLNAWVDAEKDEIVQHRPVHLGIAADTDSGLMVPVIRDADALGVLQISREVARLAAAARDRSIPRDELTGSTFTLSNVGSHAGRFATPVINAPEVGILAAGRAREGMVAKNGWFRAGLLLPLSLACDHRVVDGATAALALAEIVKLLESPEALLEPARS
ncbi:MAG: dihydrolipoamide acetyltransferase family protein [Planctomycetota bacterium]